jgi:hypothetical protein
MGFIKFLIMAPNLKDKRQVDLNLVNVSKLKQDGVKEVTIQVTLDEDSNQITLVFEGPHGTQFDESNEDIIFEGDAVVLEGNNVKWVVDSVTKITEIAIEPEFKRSSENIWSVNPKKEKEDSKDWIGTVKKLDQEGPDFLEQSYLFHYWLEDCPKRRTIDPIIRVNK